MSTFDRTPNGYMIKIDVNGFESEEVQIQTDGRYVLVTGEHEERFEDGSKYLARHFVQRFLMPMDASLEDMITDISDEGFLTITLPKKNSVKGSAEDNFIEEDHVEDNEEVYL